MAKENDFDYAMMGGIFIGGIIIGILVHKYGASKFENKTKTIAHKKSETIKKKN